MLKINLLVKIIFSRYVPQKLTPIRLIMLILFAYLLIFCIAAKLKKII